jgi:uncharacterized protein
MSYIEKVRKFVISKYTENDYKYHVSVVVEKALTLAKIKNADEEIVEMAALLHDIGRTKGVRPSDSAKNEHHLIGAKLANDYLVKIKYPNDKIEKVIACILSHRGNIDDHKPKTIEEIIIFNADAMAHFISFLDLYKNFVEDEGVQKGTALMKKKIERSWSKKLSLPQAKKMVKKEYEAITLLLSDMGVK